MGPTGSRAGKHLQNLNPYKRPIHCCDKKSMQFYVRDENKWQKDKENKKIDKSIQDLTVKQIKHLKEWEIKNPNYMKDDKLLTQWQKLVHEIMGPSNDSNKEKDKELIIKKLGKTVSIKEIPHPSPANPMANKEKGKIWKKLSKEIIRK